MEEFTNIEEMNLNSLSNEVLQGFGERYAMDASRVLNTGILLPGDDQMIQLALAITLGLYMKKIADDEFDEKRIIN
jgi:hypothetical protein